MSNEIQSSWFSHQTKSIGILGPQTLNIVLWNEKLRILCPYFVNNRKWFQYIPYYIKTLTTTWNVFPLLSKAYQTASCNVADMRLIFPKKPNQRRRWAIMEIHRMPDSPSLYENYTSQKDNLCFGLRGTPSYICTLSFSASRRGRAILLLGSKSRTSSNALRADFNSFFFS